MKLQDFMKVDEARLSPIDIKEGMLLLGKIKDGTKDRAIISSCNDLIMHLATQ